MNHLFGILVFLLGLSAPASAKSGLFVEPYVGYESVKSELIATDNSDLGSSGTAVQGGARLGYDFGRFWLAADGQMTTSGRYNKISGQTNEDTFKRTQVYLAAGYHFTERFSSYLGYGLSNSAVSTDGDATTDADTKLTGGTTMKVGIKYRLLSSVAVYFDYQTHSFKDSENAGTKTAIDTIFKTAKDTSMVLGFAFPFNF